MVGIKTWVAASLTALCLVGCKKTIPIPNVTAPDDLATIARGDYLANHVSSCRVCHSPRDWTKLGGPALSNEAFAGGENLGPFDLGEGSVLHAPNLTPAHLRDWSDGELVRAITTGMARGDAPLFPAMPYFDLRALALDDALAIVAYLRTVTPLEREVPARRLPFPL